MTKTFPIALLLSLLLLPALVMGAEVPARCSLCAGLVSDGVTVAPSSLPLLIETTEEQLTATGDFLSSLSGEQRARATVIVSIALPEADKRVEATEERILSTVAWAEKYGPFASFGVAVSNASLAAEAYAYKRLAVNIQGREVAGNLTAPEMTLERLESLHETGAQAYFDQILVERDSVAATAKWLTENDPAKKIVARVQPQQVNHLYDAAAAFADGASTVFLETANSPEEALALAAFNEAMRGDFTHLSDPGVQLLNADGTPREGNAIAFVRGEDLRTLIVTPGTTEGAAIMSLEGDFEKPLLVGVKGAANITDTGTKGGRYLIGLQPAATPFAIVVDRPVVVDPRVTKETIDVSTQRTIPVEEILRNHQAYRAFQDTIQQRYTARNETSLRFALGEAGEAVEATIAGDYFSSPGSASDWVWEEFFINGVKWKYGSIPELPLIQAEKVTQLPLDIHLTNEYRYRLAGEENVRGFDTWEVRFEPPRSAPLTLPLYRGTVWIDKRTWARVRLSMVQLNLDGEILANQEKVDYTPFDRQSGRLLTTEEARAAAPRSLLWLPTDVSAQQTLSTAGRSTVVLRSTDFSKFELSPPNFDEKLRTANASRARMVRETEKGMRYLERTAGGERLVKEEYDTSRLFLVGGLHHDDGLEFPVLPLGGVDYFNFNIKGTGMQTNVFFAGVILAANLTDPSFRKTRTNVGVDFFGLAIPFENTMFRNQIEVEGEAVKALPVSLVARVGHPVFTFGKADLSLAVTHVSFQRSDTTATDFLAPSDTYVLTPTLSARYDRWGYSLSSFYEHGQRTTWEPWGKLAEYSEDQKQFSKFGVSIGKSFYLPRFQRIGIEVNYLDGKNLDRFSKYELGFFGAQRIRGIQSGSVRADTALLAHLSYGFVFSQQFRMEAFYDQGWLEDASAGYRNEPFQGVGIGGQTIGPRGTVLRLDIGKTLGQNSQDGFVASVLVLKLFN